MDLYLAMLLGLVCAGAGGELFVRGTVGLAESARISPGIVAATVAAFATSSPELTVAVSSALAGAPEISFGNVLGANIVNVAVILGVVLMMAPLHAPRGSVKRDFPVALAVPVVVGLMLLDGRISRLEGGLLIVGFTIWLLAMLREAMAQRYANVDIPEARSPVRAIVEGVIGLALLVAAGKLIVYGGTGLAELWGLSEFVIGATIVALGTTIPEFATTLIAKLRGHDEVGLGTVLGSNIFNGLLIIGVAAMITPIGVPLAAALPALVLGAVTILFVYPPASGTIVQWRGGLLLAAYVVYLVAIFRP